MNRTRAQTLEDALAHCVQVFDTASAHQHLRNSFQQLPHDDQQATKRVLQTFTNSLDNTVRAELASVLEDPKVQLLLGVHDVNHFNPDPTTDAKSSPLHLRHPNVEMPSLTYAQVQQSSCTHQLEQLENTLHERQQEVTALQDEVRRNIEQAVQLCHELNALHS